MPFPQRVTQKIIDQGVEVVLVATFWPQRLWIQDLTRQSSSSAEGGSSSAGIDKAPPIGTAKPNSLKVKHSQLAEIGYPEGVISS